MLPTTVITVTVKAGACVNIPLLGRCCAGSIDATFSVNGVPGKIENCTDGSDYESCTACQKECVATQS